MSDAHSLAVRQRASGVGWMGVQPGVTSARSRAYLDNEVRVEYIDLAPGAARTIFPAAVPRVGVLGHGLLTIENFVVVPGQIVVIREGCETLLTAGASRVTLFLVEIDDDIGGGPAVRVVVGDVLAPFEPEGIIVAPGTANRLGARFNLAEVIVPPAVTTSEHDLGVNERYLIVDGPATVFLGGRPATVEPGDVVHIPSGTLQYLRNSSGRPFRFYCLCTPPFTPETYGAGPRKGEVPPGFELARWWEENKRVFGVVSA